MASKMLSSTAVVAKRNEDRNSLDHFPTPGWATRGLMEFLEKIGVGVETKSVLEPAAGLGHMAAVLAEKFEDVHVSDVKDWGKELGRHRYMHNTAPVVADFLADDYPIARWPNQYDWIITNPPFKHCKEFTLKAVEHAGEGVALLMRTAYLESVGRYEEIFAKNPPTYALIFSERLGFIRDKVLENTASATSHAWFLWIKPYSDSRSEIDWIPPGSRKRLERPGDYDEERIAMNTELGTAPQLFDET